MTTETLLSAQEIRRRLAYIAASSLVARNSRQVIGLNTVAKAAGLSRQPLYRIAAGQRNLGAKAQRKLSKALQSLHMSPSD